jgi:FlaA1/EpsC-like NDP-sugar epimerase
MEIKPRIALFGAGSGGLNAYEYLKNDYELVVFVDNDKRKHGQMLNGFRIISAQELRDFPVDKIVIASTYGLQIHHQLIFEAKIAPEKIIRLSVSMLTKANPLYYIAAFTVAAFWILSAFVVVAALVYWL